MTTVEELRCEQCRKTFQRAKSQQVHRIKRGMRRVFCSMKCAGKSRRVVRSLAEKKTRKRNYDKQYRAANRKRLKAAKAEHFRRTYDPEAARVERKKHAQWHLDYCRRYYADPKRKAEKADYDLNRRAAKYGGYADAFKALLALKREVLKQSPDKYERLKARGYYDQGGRGWQRNELSKQKRTT